MTRSARLREFFLVLVALCAAVVGVSVLVDVSVVALAPLYMFTPMAAALVVCRRHALPLKRAGLRLRRSRWLLVAWLLPVPIVLVTLAGSTLLPGVTYEAEPVVEGVALPAGVGGIALSLAGGVVAGATINAVFAFGEEFGWRGYLLTELADADWGFWRAAGAIGVVWGLWHAPIIAAGYNYPSAPLWGVPMMVAFCVLFSPIHVYVAVRARTVLAAALLHGSFNGVAGVTLVYVAGASEFVVGVLGLAGFAVLTACDLLILARGAPSLSDPWRPS